MKHFPQLKQPLDRRGLSTQDGLILLAYDIVWRWQQNGSISHLPSYEGLTLTHDTEANLEGLGAYIKQNLDFSRFDEDSVKMAEWKNQVEEENRRKKTNPASNDGIFQTVIK